jgi:hypothetical protein
MTGLLVAAVVLILTGTMLAGAQPDPAAPAQQASDSLVRLLAAKGILTGEEAQALAAVPAAQQRDQLTALLLKKGIISPNELQGVQTSNERLIDFSSSATAAFRPAVLVTTSAQAQAVAPKAPPAPAVIGAVAPIRVLAFDSPKRDGLIPAFKLGAVKVAPYGFVKMSLVRDSSSPLGNDFLLPGFIGDTGPNGAPEFRMKARGTRLGSNFEWMDPSAKVTITGKIEFDFEGNYTTVANRGISSLRSSQASIRLAYGRIDYAASANDNVYAVFGQDWTPFGSSTLPNTLETTGLGIGYGSLYERAQQIRGGWTHNFGGSRNFKWLTDFAIVNPSSGNQPFPFPASNQFQIPGTIPASVLGTGAATADVLTVTGCTPLPPATSCTVTITPIANNGLGVGTQLAIGERQGPDSDRPEVEGRIAFQFQLDKAKGVAPAQLILSGVQGRRESVVLAANIPTLNTAAALAAGVPTTLYTAQFGTSLTAPQHGVRTGSDRWGINPQIQLPTRWFTLLGSYYHGADLRWFFAGQILSFYNDTTGLANVVPVPNIDGSSAVLLATRAGTPTVAPQRPIRTSGGFLELGLPLSRLANANPSGRNAGWSMNLHYGRDDVNNRDLRKASPTASIRDRSDWAFANLLYKFNNWVTFGYEQSYYRTRALTGVSAACTATPTIASCFPNTLFRGLPARSWHDARSEFSTIFTF